MNSFINYLGGKSLLSKKIIPLIPEHTCYCEVFAGAAWMLFRKEESKVEIINDINSDLVALYRVIKNHLEEFIRYLKWILVARDEFERFKKEAPESLTDIQRAVRFYYLQRNSYGGKVAGQTFNIATTRPPTLNLLRIEEDLSMAHLRLSRVYIENLPYQRIIERFNKPETFFYIDPPYFNCENHYGKDIFGRDDFSALADILSRISGKFIMSINDTPEIRELFRRFRILEVETRYLAAGSSKQKKVTELLILNYNPESKIK
ncbi:MAG: DNA adenine methylase [Syntrophobacterales bacterium]|jgi:DNA adenine methylase|nr:DNA adenine methylase [Syntrophobacterales bacterium]